MCKMKAPAQPPPPAPVSPPPSPEPIAETTQEDPTKRAERNSRLAIGTNNLVVARDRSVGSMAPTGSGLGISF